MRTPLPIPAFLSFHLFPLRTTESGGHIASFDNTAHSLVLRPEERARNLVGDVVGDCAPIDALSRLQDNDPHRIKLL